ncbi:hypothetical protein SDRG_05489 [Saprolegnia diclina VS20]|uniref:Uncharacterized protein n=1 Tax=Saprolegnia diclina (strain VS20) TaxID=1156394 RepID=T0QTC4_SAPDV|nr:hypothetical protein SDRG_05489 [Saprolegnia diclina VS20]EQC37265.1 hypothetical protein SDRG_05489 [Saprolegnia diclina VS20]|eukprot:XP_008609427.1 hypothetical protein SDRG_05489 [Saprolegnia diclina VS20]
MGCSLLYVQVLTESFANDLWWPRYNATGYEAFLVDVANDALQTRPNGSLDLLQLTIDKRYSAAASSTTFLATYARRLALVELTTLEYAVTNLRALGAFWAPYMNVQHCWVDFNRTFELAHTTRRQRRCSRNYLRNAAVHVEATLRNVVWDEFIATWGGPGGMFTLAIQLALEETPAGRRWLQTTAAARASTSISAEVAYWSAHNFTRFQLNWQNNVQTGLSESFSITNALGMDHVFSIKALHHQPGPQTSVNLYWGPNNDWDVAKLYNMSLVRHSDNWIGPTDWEELDQLLNATGGLSEPLATFHNRVGPYVSIDLYLVGVPPSVMAVYYAFQALLANATVPTASVLVTPTPPAWKTTPLAYMGGNPACLSLPRFTPYVQHPFSYTDDCSGNAPFTINMTTYGMLFARLWDLANASAICAVTADAPVCAKILLESIIVAPNITLPPHVLTAASIDMVHTNASLMQFAIDSSGTWRLLREPMIAPASAAWTFFGWLLVHDWILGRREVVSFEGDVSSIVLVSDMYEPLVYPTSGGDRYMEGATHYVAYLITSSISSRVLLAVVVVCVRFLSKGAVDGSSLVFFNRVVGSVWSGRPLMFLQGMTALVMLSTAQLSLVQNSVDGATQLQYAPRPLWITAIIAGEATWVCYVLQELLLVAVGGAVTRAASPYGTAFVWATFLVIDGMYPVTAVGSLNRTCISYDMDYQLDCHSGNLRIGDTYRVILLLSIAVGVTLVSIVLARHWRQTPRVAPVPFALIPQLHLHLCGISQALLTLRLGETSHDDIAYFMSGILTWTLREQRYLFDIKTWIFVDLGRKSSAPEPWAGPALASPAPQAASNVQRSVVSLAALAYLGATIAASISYIQVSAVNLANDFCWSHFNSSGTHVFLASWINTQLVLNRTHQGPFLLTLPSINLFSPFNASTATVPAVLNYAAKLQHGVFATRLEAIVAALFLARLRPSRDQFVLAASLAQLSRATNVTQICAIDDYNLDACTAAATVAAARDVVGNVSFALFAQRDDVAPVVLTTLPLFNAPEFELYAWLFLSDWVFGNREVVAFQGDYSAITVLLESESPLQQPPNAWQVLSNVALYTRAGVLYITCVLLGVAVIVTCYILTSRGAFEWLNMLELSRVGGIVWVGRPLLLLRATTALSVLSTATLQLLYENESISAFQTEQNPWYTTILAASEVTPTRRTTRPSTASPCGRPSPFSRSLRP